MSKRAALAILSVLAVSALGGFLSFRNMPSDQFSRFKASLIDESPSPSGIN